MSGSCGAVPLLLDQTVLALAIRKLASIAHCCMCEWRESSYPVATGRGFLVCRRETLRLEFDREGRYTYPEPAQPASSNGAAAAKELATA